MSHFTRLLPTFALMTCLAACAMDTAPQGEVAATESELLRSVTSTATGTIDPEAVTSLVLSYDPGGVLLQGTPDVLLEGRLVPVDPAGCIGRHQDCPKLFHDASDQYDCHVRASHSVSCQLIDDGVR